MAAAATDPFRTRDHVADFDGYVAQYEELSAAARQRHDCRLDVPYGSEPTETLDLFLPPGAATNRPVHLFIHGGYWRMFGKGDFSFVANSVVAAGGIAAVIDYALMPSVRLATIVAQVRKAASWLTGHAQSFGGDPSRLSISGHSAGAHLCCSLLDAGAPVTPRASLLLSGLYDLKPLQTSFLEPIIGLTDDEVARFSPVHGHYTPSGPVSILVGAAETVPFHHQAAAMAQRFSASGVPTTTTTLPATNHMSIALDLANPRSAVGQELARIIAV